MDARNEEGANAQILLGTQRDGIALAVEGDDKGAFAHGNTDPTPLPAGIVRKTRVPTDHLARHVQDVARAVRLRVSAEKLCAVVAPVEKADVLTARGELRFR